MHKRFMWMIALLALLALPTIAQESETQADWHTWLFDPASGTVRVVNPAGEVAQEFTLPLRQAFNTYMPTITVAPSGGTIAYVMTDTTAQTPNRLMALYDVDSDQITATYALPPTTQATSLEFAPEPLTFDESASQFVFGYVRYDQAETGIEPGWTLVVLDYASDEVILTRTEENTPEPDSLMVPTVMNYRDGAATFITIFYATEALEMYPAFTWDTVADTVTEAERYLSPDDDTLPATGEVLRTAYDDRFPEPEFGEVIGMPPPIINVVEVYDPAADEIITVYTADDYSLISAYFVQNGERVIVNAYDADTDRAFWRLLERDGTLVSEVEAPRVSTGVEGTPNGFMYIDREDNTLYSVDTRDDTLTPTAVYTLAADAPPFIYLVQSEVAAPESYAAWEPISPPDAG